MTYTNPKRQSSCSHYVWLEKMGGFVCAKCSTFVSRFEEAELKKYGLPTLDKPK